FDSSNIDVQQYVEVPLPNTKYQRDYGSWSIQTDNKYSLVGISPLTLDWSDFSHIAYFGICADTSAPLFGGYSYILMRGFSINGTIIRAMYDSSSISTYGCRMTTIKDSFAQTDTLTSLDIINGNPNTLSLEC